MLESLKEEVWDNGVQDAVTFHGWVPHKAVQNIIAKSTLFLFPSIREFGGGAVLEAMALGVPPLIVDYAGPGELVDHDTGFKVPLGTKGAIVAALLERLEFLATQPGLLKVSGSRARHYVQTSFTWALKADQMLQIYEFASDMRPRPQFFGQGE